MRSSIMVRILAVAALVWLLALPATAAAYPMTGKCQLTLTSTDASGKTLDTIKAGDESGSTEDPFLVDWLGTVTWEGQSQVAFKDNHYHVAMFGMATPFQGEASNSADLRNTAGTFAFTANAPFRFTGTYYMSAGIIAANGTQCSGTFVVKLIGDPIGTAPFFVGLALLAIGALLLVWGFSGHLGAAIFGGLVLGLGAALEAVIFSMLPLAGLTPVAILASGLFLAAIAAVVGGRRAAAFERALAAQVAAEEAAAGVEAAPVFAPEGGGDADADGTEPKAAAAAGPEPADDVEPEPNPEPEPAPQPAVQTAAEPAGAPAATAAPAPAAPDAAVRPPDDPWPVADLPPASAEGGAWFQDTDKA